jgi:hypothetical protein
MAPISAIVEMAQEKLDQMDVAEGEPPEETTSDESSEIPNATQPDNIKPFRIGRH